MTTKESLPSKGQKFSHPVADAKDYIEMPYLQSPVIVDGFFLCGCPVDIEYRPNVVRFGAWVCSRKKTIMCEYDRGHAEKYMKRFGIPKGEFPQT